jgi:hypothetical protein
MFEEYLQDAYDFLSIAKKNSETGGKREAQRYYRAAVFYTSGAIEAFINYIADSFAKANSLPVHEICFLNDKTLRYSVKHGLQEKSQYQTLDDKIRLLMQKFVPEFDFQEATWARFMEFKDFRDSLVHPRRPEDETDPSEYQKKLDSGLGAIIEIMNKLSIGIWRKPLRKQLLDLLPE